MKTINLFNLVACVTLVTVSCSHAPEEKKNECLSSSFELSLTSKDTINRLDCHGKQGIWVLSPSNKLKDTVYYRNDTIVG